MTRAKPIPILWHGRRVAGRHLRIVEADLRGLLDNGLARPADLIFHNVWLEDDDPYGPTVSVWGRKGDHRFHAELIERPVWVTMDEAFGGEGCA